MASTYTYLCVNLCYTFAETVIFEFTTGLRMRILRSYWPRLPKRPRLFTLFGCCLGNRCFSESAKGGGHLASSISKQQQRKKAMSRPETRPYSKGGGFERASKSRRGQRGYYSEVVSKTATKGTRVSRLLWHWLVKKEKVLQTLSLSLSLSRM